MLTKELLLEVEQRCKARNHEVALFLVRRLCNYQKVKLRLSQFDAAHPEFVAADCSHDVYVWREHRHLRKKLTFKDPCYRCLVCRNDPCLAHLISAAQPS